MTQQLVFVPLDRAEAAAVLDGADPGPRPGCAPTSALAAGLGPDVTPEEVEFAALSTAGVLALATGSDPRRLVLAVDVDDRQVTDSGDDTGLVTVTGLQWDQVRALFVDEPAVAAEAVARAREAAVGLGPADALAVSEVGDLLDAHDLYWYDREEFAGHL